ncbi:histidine phosphatase family protein [Synechococcus sp. UW140]|uniref:histidine phosphatase family protein n=1 Tax=Synechococcus sp. UW140 TaxID=368503 RepID=UPI000E0FC8A8|nr:histidine phosphatase family protein [Synechococcus sp. UW140]
MQERQIWLLRHGATEWALNGRHTGKTDLPLLPEGEAEARKLAKVLPNVTFAAVFTSPLQRAQRTCEIAGLGSRAQVLKELTEWNYGDYEGLTTTQIQRSVPDWSIWSHGCPGGEDAAGVQGRCEQVINQAMAVKGEGDVALFAHGHLLRALTGSWLGLGASGGGLFRLATGSICVLGYEHHHRAVSRWNAPADGCF